MELLEWASYYNTSHANPYNNLSTIQLGMPSKLSKAYQTVVSRDSDSCSSRLRNKIFNYQAREFSVEDSKNRLDFIEYCKGIDCMWKGTCNKYLLYTNQLKRAENDEYVCMIESILGVIIEHWSEETVYNVLYEDFGCRLDDLESTVDKDLILYSYKDALNYLVLKYNIESVTEDFF